MQMADKKSALKAHLRRAILTVELAPGTPLDEAALCGAFELSRTPLREVVRDLAGEGYVDVTSGRGARVSDLSHHTLRDFFQAAPMIYEAILRLAAEGASDAQLDALEAAQDAFRAALRGGSIADRALSNVRFHDITCQMAGNIYLLPSFRRLLIDHARIGMAFFHPQSRDASDKLVIASQQHDAIIEAIRARDTATAAELAQAHWALSRSEIERFVLPSALDAPLGTLPQKRPA